ncbi:hypothetical protein [Salsipaludibacter albus]|uniref:hypothetical protein n=1 Tax=Salsipaludibacter albus TaxID=2849650 RepID=UPI001EE4A3FF|nr:hypothetical protein [Salsipaludibacter albus]MBY5164109.1 hypothetical protein [Salsipaludibacter albus]
MSDSPEVRLVALPDGLADTRDALHQLAFFVLAPRRHAAVGRLGLTAAPGGFTTSWFDDEGKPTLVRIEGVELVVETEDEERRTRPGSVRDACDFLEMPYRETWFDDFHDPLPPRDPDEALTMDAEAAAVLATWFAFGTAVLEELRATAGAVDPSTVQLWPEHFDPAVEVGSEEYGRRASYGASPGDADHPEPYLYVAPWGDVSAREWFDDPAFDGASLGHDELLASDDPFATAVAFLRHGHDLIASENAPD